MYEDEQYGPDFDDTIALLSQRVGEAKTATQAIDHLLIMLKEEHGQQAYMVETLKSKLAKLNAEDPSHPEIACIRAQIAIIEPNGKKLARNVDLIKKIASLIGSAR